MPSQSNIEKELKKIHKKYYNKVLDAEEPQERVSREQEFKENMSEYLKGNMEQRKEPNQKRAQTETMCSRWYRAPEIILLDQNYNQAVDVWSLGCIVAEMIACSNEYVDEKKYQLDKRILFKGNCCHPISPLIGSM